MEIYIDNQRVDTDRSTRVAISLSVASITEPDTSKTGYSKTVRLPMTRKNRVIMGDCDQLNGAYWFNQQTHTARIVCQGCTILEGVPQLLRCEASENGAGWYEIAVIGAGKQWVKHAAETPFRQTTIQFHETIDGPMIEQSWTWEQPVRFLPVKRDRIEMADTEMYPPVRIRSFEDYHPFIHAATLLRTILGEAGYTVESQFVESYFFDSLYVSGRYPTKNVDALKKRVDFLAGRFEEKTAQADRFGRVYADPLASFNTIGNLVDTADPKEIQNGKTVDGVYNVGDCFRKDGDRVAFIPPEAVTVGFEYRIRYTTDFIMKSRYELTCFNRLYIDEEQERRFSVPNPRPERRNSFVSGKVFKLFIFDFTQGDTYDLKYDCITNPEADPDNLNPDEYYTVDYGSFTTDTIEISVSESASLRLTNLRIYVKKEGTSVFELFTGEWGLYDGYVSKTGTTDVVLTVRSAPERILPSEPKYFNNCYFGGAEPGMNLTIGTETQIRPVFLPHPAVGSTIEFTDVAVHEIHQIDFINSLRHLFNLYFYTDEIAKKVYIEPRNDFYRSDVIIDWSQRIDRSRPIEIEEPGSDLYSQLVWAYQDGDGAVARWNETNGEKMGVWSAQVLNRCAKEGQKTLKNPLYTPSINAQEELSETPAASVVQVGDREQSGNAVDTEDLNFPPKIVRYLGLVDLPEDQRWGWPGFEAKYPLTAFHYHGSNNSYGGETPNPESSFANNATDMEQNGWTLCFEDRDGVAGLHRYYDENIELYNWSRRVTVYLFLRPEDIEPLIVPNPSGQDFRALYRLRIDGENTLFYLESIEDYVPESNQSTRCVFIKKL